MRINNYIKTAWRSLWKNKTYTYFNIAGLALGMSVALLIGLWVWDEVSFDKYHSQHDRIAIVQKNRTFNGSIITEQSHSLALAAKLRENFGDYFEAVVASSYGGERNLSVGEKNIVQRGLFMEPEGEKILDLEILEGSPSFPLQPFEILISERVKNALFGENNAIAQSIKIDQNNTFKIVGVFKNLPQNTTYRSTSFYASMDSYAQMEPWVNASRTEWNENSLPIYVKLAKNVSMTKVSNLIQNQLYEVTKDQSKPALFLYAMDDWHLYPEFKNGLPVPSGKDNLIIFSLIGILTLFLASINFMNLSTAQSEKRAKEIGLRKAIGSDKTQIAFQFYSETLITVLLAGFLALLISNLSLPYFNEIAQKQISFQWYSPTLWLVACLFSLLLVLLAGTYPAIYLSSFKPIQVLKGKMQSSKFELNSRKGLVIFQFSISVILIISTLVIYRQIQFTKNRPLGYDTKGLVQIRKNTEALKGNFGAMRQELLNSGAAVEMAEMSNPISESWFYTGEFSWPGKSSTAEELVSLRVTPEFGNAIQWKLSEGRDFTRANVADSSSVILNEAAVKLMGLEDPTHQIIRKNGKTLTIIGVVKDIVMDSPFEPVRPTVFEKSKWGAPFMTIRLNPDLSSAASMERMEKVLLKFDPAGNFNYHFADRDFDSKFFREKRMSSLITVFSVLAILISCLGLFGLASFMAEQRTKEIGIRKVLGATVQHLWQMLTKDFVVLILISCVIAAPIAYYFMSNWLQKYTYRTEISWWIFAVSGMGALLITLLTVSYQAVKAALLDPVKSLKSE